MVREKGPKRFRYGKIIILTILLLILPVLVKEFDCFLTWLGAPAVIPMSAGEYSAYIGTILAIVWAVYSFSETRNERNAEKEKAERKERPKLQIRMHSTELITLTNVGPYPAINLTNCVQPLVGKLNPGDMLRLVWTGSNRYEDLVIQFDEVVVLDDMVNEIENGISLSIFAYSKRGKLWQYECELNFDGSSQVTITDPWKADCQVLENPLVVRRDLKNGHAHRR